MRVNAQLQLAGILIASSVAQAEGQRLYPDPFLRCEAPYLVLRSADLTNKLETPRDSVTVDLQQDRLLAAPEKIQLEGVNLDGYTIGTATIKQTAEGANTCTYKYVHDKNSFERVDCDLVQSGSPTPIRTKQLQLTIPGFEELSRTTAWAQLNPVQTPQGCGGRTPLNGQKFFNRANASADLWFVLLDEASVSPNSVATIAAQMAQSVGGSEMAFYTAGPLAFALKTSATGAQTLSQDTRVRFVENVPAFTGKGIREASTSWWAQDRIDQEPMRSTKPVDNRLRWPEYKQSTTDRPSLFVLDTAVFDGHSAFSSLNFQRIDPNPSLPSCAASEVGADHGTNVAGLLVGMYSSTQYASRDVYFVKTLGRASNLGITDCKSGNGMTVANSLQQVIALARPGDIVNLSLGGRSLTGFIEMLIDRLLKMGVVIVAAAGNENALVDYPPANIPDVITVGGTDANDERWIHPTDPTKGTNFGPDVDVYGPAYNVLVPTMASSTATNTLQGTSLASPLTAGVVFHNLSTLSNWPFGQDISVAQSQRQQLIVQGVSHGTDNLPVLRGKPLEKSPASGFASIDSGAVHREKLAVDGLGHLWRGRSDDGSTYSLGRAQPRPGDHFPDPSSDFIPMRTKKETCAALSGFEGGIHPSGTGDMLVGCYGAGTAYLGIYTTTGEFREYEIESDDAPLYAHTTYPEFSTFGGVVGLMKQDARGRLRTDTASLVYFGPDINAPNGKILVGRADIVAPPDHTIFLEHVVVRCDDMPPFHCTTWATTTQNSTSILTEVDVVTYRMRFDPATSTLLEAPTIVLQHTLNNDAICGASGLGIGFGARGIGVVPDDIGDDFTAFYTTAGSDVLNGVCVRTGGTWVARAGQSHNQARRLGEGVFATSLSYDRLDRTILLGGAVEDRMWQGQSALISTDRAGFIRNVWLPAMPPDTYWAGTPELSSAYTGYFLQTDINLKTSVRWFEP